MKSYLKYLIIVLIILIGFFIYRNYFVLKKQKTPEISQTVFKVINNPKSISILKPQDFLILNIAGAVKDEILFSQDGISQQLFFYLSNNDPGFLFEEYKNYLNKNAWEIKNINKLQNNVFLITAEKNNLKLELNISPDNLSKKTFVGSIFTDNSLRYNFYEKENSEKNFNKIKFYYALPNINFVYKKNVGPNNLNEIMAQYDSYLDRDNLYNLYYNQMKEKGFEVENIKSDIASKKIISATKNSDKFMIDIDSIILSPQNPNQRQILVTIYYFYK
jgi:hypothetical protein